MPMDQSSSSSGKGLSLSIPLTIGVFFRELLAVALLITLQERAWGYDFFTPGLILFLVLITFRVPYLNSYVLLFEAFCIDKWNVDNHVGLRNHTDPIQNTFHVLMIVIAHVGGALGAAALRVFFDVTYGKEIMFGLEQSAQQTTLNPGLQVDVDGLQQINSFWGTSGRLERLRDEGIYNGTIERVWPFDSKSDLGIGSIGLVSWYVTEEIGYVFLLCVCYIHIWLSSGVGEQKRPPSNPFLRVYWKVLFQVCVLITLVYVSLYRAFPTAHGSLHVSIFRAQYQTWNPNVRLVDTSNFETFSRIVGGFVGLLLGVGYNKLLVSTEKYKPDDDYYNEYYYKLIWGLEPDHGYSRLRRQERDDPDQSSRGRRASVYIPNRRPSDSQRQCNGQCSSTTCFVCNAHLGSKSPDVKLRLPYTLDLPK